MSVGWRALPRLLIPDRLYGDRVITGTARSLFVRHVDGGSSNVAEAELISLTGPAYNLAAYGIRFVSSPSHADVLLLTGPLTRNMLGPALAAFAVMPEKAIVTVGDWAAAGLPQVAGAVRPRQLEVMFQNSYALVELPDSMRHAVVAHAAGDPPEPCDIIEALMAAAQCKAERHAARRQEARRMWRRRPNRLERIYMHATTPPARTAIVTCMDPRLQLPRVLKSAAEESFILRNAGGRVTEDVLRGLVLCTQVMDVTEIGVIHHTDCRLQKYTNEELILKTGADIDFMSFSDPIKSILQDVRRLSDCSMLKTEVRIWGGLYSIDDHTISVISDTDG